MMPPLSATSRVMKIGLSSKTESLIDMSMIAYWTIRPRLLRVPGRRQRGDLGRALQQCTVAGGSAKLLAQHVSLDQVMEATADALDAGLLRFSDGAVIGTGGFVETPNQRLAIRHVPPIVTRRAIWPRSPSRDATAAGRASATSPRSSRTTSRSSATRSSTTARACMLVVEKFPGQHAGGHPGVEEALEELRPGLTGSRSTPRSSGRRRSSRPRSTT